MQVAAFQAFCITLLADALPARLTSSHRAALVSRIRYGYQYSLRKRLEELADLLPQNTREMLFGGEGNVPGRWIDTRNYYTHWDEADRHGILDNEAMFHATVRLREVFRTLLLTLLGVPAAILEAALHGRSEAIEQLRQLNIVERRRQDPNDTSGILMTVTREDGSLDSSG